MNKEVEDENRRKLLSAVLNADDFRPAAALVRAEFGARSHRGRVHQENADHYLVVRLAQHLETLLTSLASVDSAVHEWTHGRGERRGNLRRARLAADSG